MINEASIERWKELGFRIDFFGVCPYCKSTTPGEHLCPGTKREIERILMTYEGNDVSTIPKDS